MKHFLKTFVAFCVCVLSVNFSYAQEQQSTAVEVLEINSSEQTPTKKTCSKTSKKCCAKKTAEGLASKSTCCATKKKCSKKVTCTRSSGAQDASTGSTDAKKTCESKCKKTCSKTTTDAKACLEDCQKACCKK